MKIGFYNPYFDSVGGGEKYTLTLASHWSKNHDVSIFWDTPSDIERLSKLFHLETERIHVVHNIFRNASFIKKVMMTRCYDMVFILSDGSIPTSLATHNILHLQIPYQRLSYSYGKLIRYQSIVCNSEFTKKNIDKRLLPKSVVIYPPVDVTSFTPREKRKRIILSVGRFSSMYHAKKHEVLIQGFKKMQQRNIGGEYTLVLVGGLLESDREYFDSLQMLARGYFIEFYPNCEYETLKNFYETSMVYWHAAGYGERNPEFVEHFGISTVEAMAGGTVPCVYDGGGQPEIVRTGIDGYTWNTEEELIELTQLLLSQNARYQKFRESAIKRATVFDTSVFYQKFDTLMDSIVT